MTRTTLWLAFLLAIVYCLTESLLVGLVSLALFVWGCGRYGLSKGYPRLLSGLLGILNVVGLIILYLLPSKAQESRENAPVP